MTAIKNAIEVRMYLGLNKPDGGRVYECELRDWLRDVVDSYFTGYTIIKAEGVWEGDSEDSIILEFIMSAEYYYKAVLVAGDYKTAFRQEAVLLTYKDLKGATLI